MNDLQAETGGRARPVQQADAVTSAGTSVVQAPKILRLGQVIDMTGLGRSMIYQMESELRFPKRVKIGTRAVGWIEQEVKAWLLKRIEARAS